MEQAAANTLPQGMSYEWTSTSYQEKQVGHQAYYIYALSITLVFIVLAALYESWTSPAAVILGVPMALVGVLLGLIMGDMRQRDMDRQGALLRAGWRALSRRQRHPRAVAAT